MPRHSHHLPSDDSAPRRARSWVAETLGDLDSPPGRWRQDLVRDAVLCTSELVTDSLIANSTTVDLRLLVEPDFFRLSVIDDCRVVSDRYDPGFRAQLIGFRLVDALADDWGIEPTTNGRELWAVFRAGTPELGS